MSGLQFDFALMARAVSSSNGELFIHSGGVRAISIPSFPAGIPLSLAARFLADDSAIGEHHTLTVAVRGPHDVAPRFQAPIREFEVVKPPGTPPDALIHIVVAITVVMPLDGPGAYHFDLLLDGERVEERGDALTLRVTQG